MKFVRYNGGRTGIVVDRSELQVVDVIGALPQLRASDAAAADAIGAVLGSEPVASWVPMIAAWDDLRDGYASLERLCSQGLEVDYLPFESALIEAPLPAPTVHIWGAGSNTVEHVQHAFRVMKGLDLSVDDVLKPKREGEPPSGFMIWPSSVIGTGATVTPPPGFTKLDYEGECAAIVRSAGVGLKSVEIWGYAAWSDFGVRDPHLGLAPESKWIPFSLNLPKNFDSANGFGPWIAVDEGEFSTARCKTLVNGEVRQDWPLSDMIYSFEDAFAFISTYQALRPGDIVTSGTGPGVAIEGGRDGPNWLKAGDIVDIVLDGAGTLSNRIGTW